MNIKALTCTFKEFWGFKGVNITLHVNYKKYEYKNTVRHLYIENGPLCKKY